MAEEKKFENKIKNFISTLPHSWHYKHHATGFGRAGIPDIIACINGRFVAIEVKASKGKASPLQERNIKLINEAGGYGCIVKPDDFEELQSILIKISKGEF